MDQIPQTIEQITECEDRADEIWFSRTKFSVIHEDRLRIKVRRIHLIEEGLFFKLWDLYQEDGEVEEIDDYLWCDGKLHFKVDEDYNLIYGSRCNC